MKVKIKKLHQDAVIPSYAKKGDAGLDLVAVSVLYKHDQVVYDTGLAFEIPEGHVGLLFPRSSICKKSLTLSNSVGVLDSGYRGSVKFVFNVYSKGDIYGIGERVGQLLIVPYPTIELEQVDELDETERGSGGFGSSGK
jgi:dUTP pyrophosphatase